jgi:hypothetical protein
MNAPWSFETEIEKLQNVTVHRKLPPPGPITFVLSFVTRQSEVDSTAESLAGCTKGDAII